MLKPQILRNMKCKVKLNYSTLDTETCKKAIISNK